MISQTIKEIRTQEVLFEKTLPAILRGSDIKPREVMRLVSKIAKKSARSNEAKEKASPFKRPGK